MSTKQKKKQEEKKEPKKYNYKIKENGKKATGRPEKRTKEFLEQEFKDILECAKIGVPGYVGMDGKIQDRSPVYLKSKLCFHRDYSRDAIVQAIREYEEKTGDKQFSAFVKEIDVIIENRLYEEGLLKNAEASLVRLGLAAKHGRTTERTENKNDNTTKGEIVIKVPGS